jgi:hypothetical protein
VSTLGSSINEVNWIFFRLLRWIFLFYFGERQVRRGFGLGSDSSLSDEAHTNRITPHTTPRRALQPLCRVATWQQVLLLVSPKAPPSFSPSFDMVKPLTRLPATAALFEKTTPLWFASRQSTLRAIRQWRRWTSIGDPDEQCSRVDHYSAAKLLSEPVHYMAQWIIVTPRGGSVLGRR